MNNYSHMDIFFKAVIKVYGVVCTINCYALDDLIGHPVFHDWCNRRREPLRDGVLNKLKLLAGENSYIFRKVLEARTEVSHDVGGR